MKTNETRDIFDGLDPTKLETVVALMQGLLAGSTTMEKIQVLSELMNNADLFKGFPDLLINKAEFGEVNNINNINKTKISTYVNIATAYKYGDLLNKTSIQNYNNSSAAYNKVQAELAKLKKNLAAFDIYNKTKTGAKTYLETFLNTSGLDFLFPVEKTRLAVDTDAGVVTLPRDGEVTNFIAQVDNIRISESSNGSLGTSVSSDGLLHDDLRNLFDGNQTTWVEYEKISPIAIADELVLEFTLALKSSSIINALSLIAHPVNGLYPEIVDILLSANGIGFTSIYENNELKSWLDSPSSSVIKENDQGAYSVYFMPQKAKFVKIKIKQSKQYVATKQTIGRVYRQVIALKEVAPLSIKYKDSGEIISNKIETEGTYGAIGLYSNDIFFNDKFGKVEYYVSKDDGQSWTGISPIDEKSDLIDEIVAFDNVDSQLRVKMKLTRDSAGFNNISSNNNAGLITYTQVAKLPSSTPFSITLDQAPADDDIFMGVIGVGSVGKNNNFYVEKNVSTQKRLFNLSTNVKMSHVLYTEYNKSLTVNLPTPNNGSVDQASIVVTTVATPPVAISPSVYKFNQVNNSLFFLNNGSNTAGQSIQIAYDEDISNTITEYVVELPYPLIASKQGKYLVYVDGTLFSEANYSTAFTSSTQYKIRYGTNEIIFATDVAGQNIKIVIDYENPVFSKSAPHIHTLEVPGNGIKSELKMIEFISVANISRVIPPNTTIFNIPENFVITSEASPFGLSAGSYLYDEATKNLILTTPSASPITITYNYITTREVPITYADRLYNTVSVLDRDFSSNINTSTVPITSTVYSALINIGSSSFIYNISPNILIGSTSVVGSTGAIAVVPFIDGASEFRSIPSSSNAYSVDAKNGKFYFKNVPGTCTIQYSYTKYKLSYGFSIQIDSTNFTIRDGKELILTDAFISKLVAEGVSSDKTVTIRYNIKDEKQATLSELEKFYSPYIFDFSLIFGR